MTTQSRVAINGKHTSTPKNKTKQIEETCENLVTIKCGTSYKTFICCAPLSPICILTKASTCGET
eukprot:scaffold243742_cov14-Tisochrysis_lutea.AAC.1